MKIGSLFSGIGGLELGLEWAGLGETVWQVENNEFCQKVLAKHWPNVKRYGDIKDVGSHNLEPVDLICGGFPCQPFSVARKRKGKSDDRFLWPEMLRVITELHPSFVIGENVSGFVNMALDQVLSELENIGYETATLVIPACAVNAPHRRDRVFVIAYSTSIYGNKNVLQFRQNTTSSKQFRRCAWDEPSPKLCRVDDELPSELYRLKSLGNAVVPQVSYAIGLILKEWLNTL